MPELVYVVENQPFRNSIDAEEYAKELAWHKEMQGHVFVTKPEVHTALIITVYEHSEDYINHNK